MVHQIVYDLKNLICNNMYLQFPTLVKTTFVRVKCLLSVVEGITLRKTNKLLIVHRCNQHTID